MTSTVDTIHTATKKIRNGTFKFENLKETDIADAKKRTAERNMKRPKDNQIPATLYSNLVDAKTGRNANLKIWVKGTVAFDDMEKNDTIKFYEDRKTGDMVVSDMTRLKLRINDKQTVDALNELMEALVAAYLKADAKTKTTKAAQKGKPAAVVVDCEIGFRSPVIPASGEYNAQLVFECHRNHPWKHPEVLLNDEHHPKHRKIVEGTTRTDNTFGIRKFNDDGSQRSDKENRDQFERDERENWNRDFRTFTKYFGRGSEHVMCLRLDSVTNVIGGKMSLKFYVTKTFAKPYEGPRSSATKTGEGEEEEEFVPDCIAPARKKQKTTSGGFNVPSLERKASTTADPSSLKIPDTIQFT